MTGREGECSKLEKDQRLESVPNYRAKEGSTISEGRLLKVLFWTKSTRKKKARGVTVSLGDSGV